MKALIISVGTGTSQKEEAVINLAKAITFSIKQHNPNKTYFIVSKESIEKTLPYILKDIQPNEYETIEIENPDDIQQIYEKLRPKINEIRKKFNQLTIDYTSGTKAMTSALTILGTVYEADTLRYITGKRIGGIVQHGTEKLNIVRPYFATTEQKIKTATEFFNKNQFQATITIINQIKETTNDPTIINRITPLKKLAETYDQWDRFQHKQAFQKIKTIDNPKLNKNKQFLGKLIHQLEKNEGEPEPFYIADLINNAERRGTDEKRYDDAVARLYRTIELIAQYRLRKKYGIITSKVKKEQIPHKLTKEWNIPPQTEKIKIPLEKSYRLLEELGDNLGKTFNEDKKLKDLLSKRNNSILAHNIKPVNQQTYIELHKKTIEYSLQTVKNLKKLLEDSKFIKLQIKNISQP